MPKAVVQSSFTQEMAGVLQGAHEEHKGDEADYGNVGLPAGIDNGRAILNKMEFRKVREGRAGEGGWEFFASGIVQFPESFNGIKTKNQRTFITEPLYDTPTRSRKTVKEHYAFCLNQMRILGVDTKGLQYAQVEAVAAGLVQAQKEFAFQTFKMPKQDIKMQDGKWHLVAVDDNGNPVGKSLGGPYTSEAAGRAQNQYAGREPLVNHRWMGEVAPSSNGQAGPEAGFNDKTAAAPARQQISDPVAGTGAKIAAQSTVLPQSQAEEAIDFDALSAAASSTDESIAKPARTTITKLANQYKVVADVENSDSWVSGVAIIKAAMSGEETESTESTATETAQWSQSDVGSIFGYPITDPKTKTDAIGQVEIISFNEESQSVTLKNLSSNKLLMGPNKKALQVSVNDLVAAPE